MVTGSLIILTSIRIILKMCIFRRTWDLHHFTLTFLYFVFPLIKATSDTVSHTVGVLREGGIELSRKTLVKEVFTLIDMFQIEISQWRHRIDFNFGEAQNNRISVRFGERSGCLFCHIHIQREQEITLCGATRVENDQCSSQAKRL